MSKLRCIDGIKRRFEYDSDGVRFICKECNQPVVVSNEIPRDDRRLHICTTGRIVELLNDLTAKRAHIRLLKEEYTPIKERHEQAEAEDKRRWELIHEIRDYAMYISVIKKKLGIEEKKK